jgi:hypothetical protein
MKEDIYNEAAGYISAKIFAAALAERNISLCEDNISSADAHGTSADAHGTFADAHGTFADAHGTSTEAPIFFRKTCRIKNDAYHYI